MEIGEPLRRIVVDPIELPVPEHKPEFTPTPEPTPVPEPAEPVAP